MKVAHFLNARGDSNDSINAYVVVTKTERMCWEILSNEHDMWI